MTEEAGALAGFKGDVRRLLSRSLSSYALSPAQLKRATHLELSSLANVVKHSQQALETGDEDFEAYESWATLAVCSLRSSAPDTTASSSTPAASSSATALLSMAIGRRAGFISRALKDGADTLQALKPLAPNDEGDLEHERRLLTRELVTRTLLAAAPILALCPNQPGSGDSQGVTGSRAANNVADKDAERVLAFVRALAHAHDVVLGSLAPESAGVGGEDTVKLLNVKLDLVECAWSVLAHSLDPASLEALLDTRVAREYDPEADNVRPQQQQQQQQRGRGRGQRKERTHARPLALELVELYDLATACLRESKNSARGQQTTFRDLHARFELLRGASSSRTLPSWLARLFMLDDDALPQAGGPDIESVVKSVLDVLPDEDLSVIRACVTHERFRAQGADAIVAALIEARTGDEAALPGEIVRLRGSQKQEIPPREAPIERRNVFDGERLTARNILRRNAAKTQSEEEMDENLKAAIIRRATASSSGSSDEDEDAALFGRRAPKTRRDEAFVDQYDEDELIPVRDGQTASDDDGAEENASADSSRVSQILESAYLRDSSLFQLSSRRTPAREALRESTGMADEQIEGWRAMLERQGQGKIDRIRERHGLMAANTNREREAPASSRGGGGRGRGGGGGGRGGRGGASSNSGGGGDRGGSSRGRGRGGQRAAHKRRTQGHDRKMARTGGP